jgi:hypothetical protein
MKLFLIALALIGFAYAAIGIKMFLIKGGMFVKTCSTVETDTGKRVGCTCGAKPPGERCENYEAHHGSADTAKRIATLNLKLK